MTADRPPAPESATPTSADGRHRQDAGAEGAVARLAQAIAMNPNDPEAHHGLGMALRELGRLADAEASFRAALRLRPDDPLVYGDLGDVLYAQGRLADAVQSYRAALALGRSLADTHNNLGNALYLLGQPEAAAASYREALRLRPDVAEIHGNLGNALGAAGHLAEAAASYREALRLRPAMPDMHRRLGNALRTLGRPAEGAASFREALRLRPDDVEAYHGLGTVLRELGRAEEAAASCRQALHLRPDYADAHNNLGNALFVLGRPAEAAESYRTALRLRPDYADAHTNLGNTLYALGRPAEATTSYREAVRLRPDLPAAHNNLGLALLLTGRFEEGWHEHEWRWQAGHMAGSVRNFTAPLWGGEPIGDRVILLHAEQGLGDTLQFCRYVPLMPASAKVLLEVQPPLQRLLSRLPGVTTIARGRRLPSFDLHCPLMSLPRAFGTTLETIPAATPYLTADPALAAAWRRRLSALRGLRIGLAWAGGRRSGSPELDAIDRRRSLALEALAPLSEAAGVSFVSLQKGEPAAEAARPPRGLRLHDFTADLHDFADTAALVDGLDLVISVDTSVVHLAGALGKPVWLLNRFDTCWRWLTDRDDSPWYPTLRQFRQARPGDWTSVVERLREALLRLAAGGGAAVMTLPGSHLSQTGI